MPYVAPVTLTRDEQQALLRVSEAHPRDQSLALGTGLCLAELLGLDQDDLFARHASPLTTTAYTHPGDGELLAGVEGIAC